MPLNRSLLFRTAWRNARNAAAAHRIPIREAFAAALRRAWADFKARMRPTISIATATDTLIADIRARKAAGENFFSTKPWRFANAAQVAW